MIYIENTGWAGELVGKMYTNNVTKSELANKLGVSRQYLWSVLKGIKKTKGAEQKFNQAFEEIVKERARQ